jgi:choline transport protein
MFWSYISNVFAGIAMLVVMLFCIGPISNVLESEAPFIVLFNRLNTGPLALFLTVTLSILMLFGNITAVATASREVWAFSRDRGFPCSNWISVVDTDKNIPVHAVYLTVVLAGVLCLVNMGGTLAFEIVMSTCLLGILSTYMLSIGCVIYRRLRGDTLPPARWSLGRYGLAVNLFGFFYCGFVIVFACFPTKYPVRIGDANWYVLLKPCKLLACVLLTFYLNFPGLLLCGWL